LHKPQHDIQVMMCLIDECWSQFKKRLIGIAKMSMSDNGFFFFLAENVGYMNVILVFTMTVPVAANITTNY